ncbi:MULTISPECIES: SusD/RagB family nutrient-binding outer membrane lipoprotein [unclassified Sphingobacterium]|uniref:SusD/RagB family nutrient-binding outer membrane lipoprotein n=1 Tax=unclassified Sphingobacterium TaxID=2609468 RepID=UPI00265CD05E|nr:MULTISPECIES: SusD/RagB family nutrient-binding outer membrane lipoprotein [unclassified Sphingobacterium]WKK58156.1 SusD/RagB family nutrient-binding outer membrane lipoprotein [Sphingobacterium sp. BN32]
MFKKLLKYTLIGAVLSTGFSSCEKALDINDNPNNPTESTPQLVLPQAIVGTSRLVPTFSTYGGRIMYFANAGGVSGWGNGFLDYNYSTGDNAALWTNTYNVLMDIAYTLKNTEADENLAAYHQAAQVFWVYNFMNLVDTYNDIPYSEAFKGVENLYPKYDKAQDIYADLAARLDKSIAYFKSNATLSQEFTNGDIVFKGNATNWARLANTLKLKLVIKGKGKVTFASEAIDAVGLITDDVQVQPGFAKLDGKQNPMWNTWAYVASGTSVGTWGTQFIPTYFVIGFYDGYKIDDIERAKVTFANGLSVPKNQLGYQEDPPTGVAPSAWVLRPTSGTISATNYRGIGVVKGPTAAQPVVLLAEAKFLAAEAAVRGILSGDAKKLFEEGIAASYTYLNKNEVGTFAGAMSAADYLALYLSENATSPLVNFSLATTEAQKLEAIITQKYIAFNFLFGHEAWNEYRRTGYPSIKGANNTSNYYDTFVSIGSVSTAPDKLPTRLLYPNTESAYNGENVPTVNKFSSKIFWAK